MVDLSIQRVNQRCDGKTKEMLSPLQIVHKIVRSSKPMYNEIYSLPVSALNKNVSTECNIGNSFTPKQSSHNIHSPEFEQVLVEYCTTKDAEKKIEDEDKLKAKKAKPKVNGKLDTSNKNGINNTENTTKGKLLNEKMLTKKVKEQVHRNLKKVISNCHLRNNRMTSSRTIEKFLEAYQKTDILNTKRKTKNVTSKSINRSSFKMSRSTSKKPTSSKKSLSNSQMKSSNPKSKVTTSNGNNNKSFIFTLGTLIKEQGIIKGEEIKNITRKVAANRNASKSCRRIEKNIKSEILLKPTEYYLFSISEGNNSQLIRKCFTHRLNWKEINDPYIKVHYKWQPTSQGIRFELLSRHSHKQMVNHFEGHKEITTKNGLLRNLIGYCELNKLNAFDYTPLTFALGLDSASFASDLEKFRNCFSIIKSNTELDLSLSNKKLGKLVYSKDRRTAPHCKLKLHNTLFAGKNLWVFKPTGYNRGRGVSVFDSISSLHELLGLPSLNMSGNFIDLKKRSTSETIKARTFVIQKYIERPLLIHKRKFDVRVWVLVTHELKVYFFKEGYLRTSSECFTLDKDSITSKDIHLTNNAIQKHCSNYGQHEDGNQLSFTQFQVVLHLFIRSI